MGTRGQSRLSKLAVPHDIKRRLPRAKLTSFTPTTFTASKAVLIQTYRLTAQSMTPATTIYHAMETNIHLFLSADLADYHAASR